MLAKDGDLNGANGEIRTHDRRFTKSNHDFDRDFRFVASRFRSIFPEPRNKLLINYGLIQRKFDYIQ